MSSSYFPHRTDSYKPYLAWFCFLALVWTTFMLYAGGFTTSIQAGMAFLDWPLSNGSINPDGWLTDREMLAEHSHRLIGTKLGILMIILFVWTLVKEKRRFLRHLALAALILVIIQGGLGGARVAFDKLNIGTESNAIALTFAIAHACLAQLFLCLLVTVSLCASRPWATNSASLSAPADSSVRKWGSIACGAIFLQLLVGAIMRHNHAGLAISTFPWSTAEGGILPLMWSFPISIHFAHRVGAVVVTILLLIFVYKLWRSAESGRILVAGAMILVALLGLQIFLGALTVLTLKNEYAATLHMLCGAFLLATTWLLTFICFRLPQQQQAQAASVDSATEMTGVKKLQA